jgi:plastocyanin
MSAGSRLASGQGRSDAVRKSLVAVSVFALVMFGCSGQQDVETPAAPTSPASPASAGVQCDASGAGAAAAEVFDFGYRPDPITISANGQVEWTNTGTSTHTLTFDNGPDCGRLAPGARMAVLFSAPGTYTYHCVIHPQMKGTVIVQ